MSAERQITPRQLGSILTEFRRLGLTHPTWREYRLAIAAVFTGREELASTKDLSLGEAGLLLTRLRECRDCRTLAALLAAHAVETAQADH